MATSAAARLARLTRDLGQIDQVIVRTAGEIVADALTKQLNRDTGGDQALSGIAKGRYRMAIDITPLRNPAGVRIRPKGKQSGMWTLLDSGRSGYTVSARARRKRHATTKRGSSRARAMRIGGGGWATGPWHVGGTSGRHTWTRGRDAGLSAAIDAVRVELHRVVSSGG